MIFLGFVLAGGTVALTERVGQLQALVIMAGVALVVLLALVGILAIETRRERRIAARRASLDRQLLRAAAISAAGRGIAAAGPRGIGLGLVALGALLVLARPRDDDDARTRAMLKITDDDAHNCLVLEPTGPLTRRDLDALTERFDERVNETDRVPNLVIRAGGFPAWADFAALLKHLRFIREHHRLVERVAIVSDARALDLAPRLARRFVSADVRHFPAAGFEAALAWVGEAPAETRATSR